MARQIYKHDLTCPYCGFRATVTSANKFGHDEVVCMQCDPEDKHQPVMADIGTNAEGNDD